MVAAGYIMPWSLGPFRRSFVAPTVKGKVGVGILCFNSLPDVQKGLPSVIAHAKPEYELLVFDNGDDLQTPVWMASTHPNVPYTRSYRNTGCGNARNRMLEHFAARGSEYVMFQDMDVRWTGDAAAAMTAVFRKYPDTGCVSWKLATETMGRHKIDATGALLPSESPGMCCMFSVPALLKGKDPDLVGWYRGYGLCYRFDTDVCFSLWSKGFKTRVVMDGKCLVEHDHPHRGVSTLGHQRIIENAHSARVFQERRKKYQWPSL